MNDKLPNATKLKAKYQTLKGEVQSKLGELNNELVKDELSHDILAKKDELVELLLKKYSTTKTTALREASELRSTVSGIIKTAMNATVDDIKADLKDVKDAVVEKSEDAKEKIKEAITA